MRKQFPCPLECLPGQPKDSCDICNGTGYCTPDQHARYHWGQAAEWLYVEGERLFKRDERERGGILMVLSCSLKIEAVRRFPKS